MRYIGPFFRMNSLSQKEISGQLFHLSKESIKTLVLNSKCGLLAQVRTSKKSSINDISILNNFSPLVCLYRKASPVFIHSKTSHGFDESTFKKEINPSTNAFMTLSLLELSDYYSHYNDTNRNVSSLEEPYKYLAKEQLQFYSEHLRNDEGLFVTKKNTSESNSKGYSLVDKNNKFKFSDQAFMMDAYYLYYYYNKNDESSKEYSKFSNEILSLFIDYKETLYDLSFSENVQILLALNIYFKYSKNSSAKELILNLCDLLINKFDEKDYYIDSLDDCALFSLCLMESYKHTGILSFKDESKEINERLINLYNSDKNIFMKLSDKKEYKYSCTEINLYLLCLLMYSYDEDKSSELKPIISNIYRKFFINGGLLTSWPEAPTLDEVERYKNLSLRSNDMLDETYFRMPILPTPKSLGVASIFVKSLTYSKKKDSLSSGKSSFDSNKNMFNFYLIIYMLKDKIKDIMGFINKPISKISDSAAKKDDNNKNTRQTTDLNNSLVCDDTISENKESSAAEKTQKNPVPVNTEAPVPNSINDIKLNSTITPSPKDDSQKQKKSKKK